MVSEENKSRISAQNILLHELKVANPPLKRKTEASQNFRHDHLR